MKLDKETAHQLLQGEAVRSLLQSDGWKIVRKYLENQMEVLDSVSSLPVNLPIDEIGRQAMYRAHAISLVKFWLEAIEGRAIQHQQQAALVAEQSADEIIRAYRSTSA